MLSIQTIFMLNMPERQPFIIVADPKIARLLIEGDKSKEIDPAEKTHHYKQIIAMNGGFNMMASRFTHNDGWAATRKVAIASYSSIANFINVVFCYNLRYLLDFCYQKN
jgi:hypothetical protein